MVNLKYYIRIHVLTEFYEYTIELQRESAGQYDAIVAAVGHVVYATLETEHFRTISNGEPILVDIKGAKEKSKTFYYSRL